MLDGSKISIREQEIIRFEIEPLLKLKRKPFPKKNARKTEYHTIWSTIDSIVILLD